MQTSGKTLVSAWTPHIDQWVERAIYAAMAAVLIIPEPTTFLIFLTLAAAMTQLTAQFAWSLLGQTAPVDAAPAAQMN